MQRLFLFETAIDLYKDDYLISDPYADWLQAERERLRERFFNALLQLAELYAERAATLMQLQPAGGCWRGTKSVRTPIRR